MRSWGPAWMLCVAALAACHAPRPAAYAGVVADDRSLRFFLDRHDRFRRDPTAMVAVDILASADADHDGKDDRDLAFVAGDALIVEDRQSRELRSYPIDGGKPSVLATGLPRIVLPAGDARGSYWVTAACEIWQAPAQKLATCTGSPWHLLVDARDLYVFAEVRAADGLPGMIVWRLPRAAGPGAAVERLADLSGLQNRRPDERPLQDERAFYFTDFHRKLVRVDKRSGALATLAAVDPSHAGRLRLAGLDAERAYWSLDGRLLTVPVTGGPPVAIANIDGHPVHMLGDRFYVQVGGTLFAAPRAGGQLQRVATLPMGLSDLFERGGRLYALGRDHLVRLDLAGKRPRRLFDTDGDVVIGSLAESGANLYFTLGEVGELRELSSLSKRGGAPVPLVRGARFDAAPAVDGAHVYFVDAGNLRRVGVGGGALETLATQEAVVAALGVPAASPAASGETEPLLPHALVLADTFVYWRHAGGRGLLKLPKPGGRLAVVAAGGEADRIAKLFETANAERLVRGDATLFTHGDQVRSRSRHDGSERVLASRMHSPAALTADEEAVYFVEIGERGGIVSGFQRHDCCVIWTAAR